jgi:hypothetical protein
VFAVLLATMAVPSIGGPVAIGTWHHPCGHSVRADSNTHERTRHGLTKLLRAVKTQIGVAKKYFIKERENINKTYRQVSAQCRSLVVEHEGRNKFTVNVHLYSWSTTAHFIQIFAG